MYKCSVKIDKKLQDEINAPSKRTGLILLVIGIVGIIICAYFITENKTENIEMLLLMSCLVFALGLATPINIYRINKKVLTKSYTNDIEIFEKYIVATTYEKDDKISTIKTYYKDVFKLRESENYLFVYTSLTSVLAIPKKAFTLDEISQIKLWIITEKNKNK